MTVETHVISVPMYNIITDESCDTTMIEYAGETEICVTEIHSQVGCRFKRTTDGALLGNSITLGSDDVIGDYTEIPIDK